MHAGQFDMLHDGRQVYRPAVTKGIGFNFNGVLQELFQQHRRLIRNGRFHQILFQHAGIHDDGVAIPRLSAGMLVTRG
jgi:hypothetical protein